MKEPKPYLMQSKKQAINQHLNPQFSPAPALAFTTSVPASWILPVKADS